MADLIGKVLDGKYRLVRRLGSGGVGTVYEAVHAVIGQKFAVKILKPEFAGSPTLALRLVQEAKAASAVEHPSIIKVFDAGRTKDGLTFLVMELLVGEELAAHIKAQPVPLACDEAVDITSDVLDALVAAHKKGIIHRDLKPENVFLISGPHGQRWIKLLDFGIAKIVDHKMAAPRLTHAGTVVGTPFYMAPEHARGARDLDARVDVYATGVMLFEMLTKRVPFDGHSYNEVLAKVLSEPFPRPRKFNPDIPEALEALILRATAKDRDARFPSAQAFLEAVEPFRPETPSAVFRLSDSAAVQRERERQVKTGELEMLPEEAIATMAGEAPFDQDRLPSRPPPPPAPTAEGTASGEGEPISVSGEAIAGVTSAETRDLPDEAGAQAARASHPATGVREAGTLAGASISSPTEKGIRQRRVALWASLGAVLAVVVATIVWALVQAMDVSPEVGGSPVRADVRVALPSDGVAADVAAVPETSPVAVAVDASDVSLEPDVPASAVSPASDAGEAGEGTTLASAVDAGPPKVTVRVLGLPPEAKVFVDGIPTTNPFQLESSAAPHRLKVTARGWQPFISTFTATEDIAIAVPLVRVRGTGSADAAAPPPDSRAGQLLPDPHFLPH
jgi:serine/threonine protein kinase